MDHYTVSVKSLIETVIMKGDIDTRYVKKSRAVLGTKIHQMLQKQYHAEDLTEVTVKKEIVSDDISLTVQGRIDGVLSYETDPTIEEIKSTAADLKAMDEPYDTHFAQAKIYAYLYMDEHDLSDIRIRLTYYHIHTKQIKSFDTSHAKEELYDYFDELTKAYFIYLRMMSDLRKERNSSVGNTDFPYAYRKYQKAVITQIYRTVDEEKNIFINAPTGTGKTINALFPALKIMPKLSEGKIFYLSSKSTQKQIAENTLSLLQENGLQIKSITITAKEKVCKLDTPSCNPEDCPYAVQYYDKLFDAIKNILENETIISADILSEYAEEASMCPFELSLDLALWADVIICDYNYVFDPFAALKRFFDESAQKADHILLIDEAHNLVDRSRDMYSSFLDKSAVLAVKRNIKENKKLNKALNAINKELLAYQKTCADDQNILFIDTLSDKLMGNLYQFINLTDDYLSKSENRNSEAYTLVRELSYDIYKFLSLTENAINAHSFFYDKAEKKLFLFCSDAQEYLRAQLQKTKSGVFFSATLSPLSYYCELLGGDKEDHLLNVPAIFNKENFKIIVDTSVRTTYKQRVHYYRPIAEKVRHIAQTAAGNYFVFFPSYAFMRSVYETYDEESAERILMQSSSMSENERQEFLAQFTESSNLTAFAVAGGIFSEGIDLIGERLKGVIVCGVSLPKICTERELIRQHFDSEHKNGFEYAYLYPGMNKVLQSMGRVIRTKDDAGFAVLMDERFRQPSYLKCFPPQYDHMCFVKSNEELLSFFIDDNIV